ncbi:hypothetical protein D9M71_434290 [compost metagenome]
MPTETAATSCLSGFCFSAPRFFSAAKASMTATVAPVIDAVRVPPSAWITSQSMYRVFSPSLDRSSAARSERPIRRWISRVRPPCLPRTASRWVREPVARGSMPYSAVSQPWPCPLRKRGTPASTLTVQITLVSPNSTSTEPSACLV